MKKLKAVFLIATISTSVTAAVSGMPESWCLQQTQYYRMNTPWGYYFVPAGQPGIDHYCGYAPSTVCTWSSPPGSDYLYVCQMGQFIPLCY